MSSVTQSNKSSAVVSALVKHADKQAFVYGMENGLPNHSHEIVYSTKAMSSDNAATYSFDVVKAGILSKCWLKVEVQYATSITKYATDGFLNMLNSVTLSNNNRTLEVLHPQDIRAYINSLPERERQAWDMAVMRDADAAVANAAPLVAYLPLPFSFADSAEKYLDTNYLDNLRVSVQINALSTVMTGAGAFSTSASKFHLYGDYIVMEESAYATYRDNQFKGKPLEYLWKSSFQEGDVNCTATTSFTVNLACDNVVTKTRVRVLNKAAADDSFFVRPVSRAHGAGEIKSLQLKGNGKVLWEGDALAICAFNGIRLSQDDATSHDAEYFGDLELDWRTLVPSSADMFKGGLSLKNIAGPQLVITMGTAATADDDIQINHEVMQFISVDNKSGRMDVASSL